jgi:hypothetical protein
MLVESLIAGAITVLLEPDPFKKQELTDEIAKLWRGGSLPIAGNAQRAPDSPARSHLVQVVAPRDMPKLGKGGTLTSRQVAAIHSLFAMGTDTFLIAAIHVQHPVF